MAFLGLTILALFLLLGPLFGILAWIRVEQVRKAGGGGDLARRIDQLERQLAALRGQAGPPTAVVEPTVERGTEPDGEADEVEVEGPPPDADEAAAAPAPDRETSPSSWRDLDLEALIAGRWLNRIGILVLLLGVAFFLRFAFENDWVGPRGRVAIGLVGGASLLVYAHWLAGRGMRYFAEGIVALGVGALYLSVYAAWSFYDLIPQPLAFAALALVTTTVIAISVRQDSQRIAVLALAAGFLTPGLLSTGSDAQAVLFGYLALLGVGLLAIAYLRGFRTLGPASLIATVAYFAAWFERFYRPDRLVSTLAFGTLFFVIYFALPLARLRSLERLHPEESFVLVANLGAYVFLLERTLYTDHRWTLTAAVLVLGGLHLAVASRLGAAGDERRRGMRLLFAGLALTLATIALPVRLSGDWLLLALSVEAAVLVATGLRIASGWMRLAGAVLFAIALALVPASLPGDPDARVLLNLRFCTLVVVAASLTSCWVMARGRAEQLLDRELQAWGLTAAVGNLIALLAVSIEIWDFAASLQLGLDRRLAQQLALSLLWMVWASTLVIAGLLRRSAGLRWLGLALVGVVVAKTFLVDLSFLERQYRILSFL
ncbi:MAG: DUF2339 domain-containing protein, partial [Thermoanaerobaculia bacterium]|nr:DUF2339 domain-containing protein [Thermoanaerobaculia bacterium]